MRDVFDETAKGNFAGQDKGGGVTYRLTPCLHIVFRNPNARKRGVTVLEFSLMLHGFMVALPCILPPQSLLKFYGISAYLALKKPRTFLKKPTKKRCGRFFS